MSSSTVLLEGEGWLDKHLHHFAFCHFKKLWEFKFFLSFVLHFGFAWWLNRKHSNAKIFFSFFLSFVFLCSWSNLHNYKTAFSGSSTRLQHVYLQAILFSCSDSHFSSPPLMMSWGGRARDVKKYQMMNYDYTIIVNSPARVMASRGAFMSSRWLRWASSNC